MTGEPITIQPDEPSCTLYLGDCREVLRELPDASVDAVVTDPPYMLGFMNKEFDRPKDNPASSVELWAEVLRVTKPGGHLLAFGGSRTYHRLTCAVEDAGFEIRDSIPTLHWVYGSGMPKNTDVGRVIDMELCELPGRHFMRRLPKESERLPDDHVCSITKEGDAHRHEGTALKPAHEPIVVARKPLDGTIAQNVLKHSTGGINIDACRIGDEKITINTWDDGAKPFGGGAGHEYSSREIAGRWPPNVLFSHHPSCRPIGKQKIKGDHRKDVSGNRPGGFGDVGADSGSAEPNARVYGDSEVEIWECVEDCPVAELDRQSGVVVSGKPTKGATTSTKNIYGSYSERSVVGYGDTGYASRYFPCFHYCAKASREEREAGCESLPVKTREDVTGREPDSPGQNNPRAGIRRQGEVRNTHATVKPIELMQWLVRLVTPPGGTVIDPFLGSGTTGIACWEERFSFIGIEKEPEYFEIAKARIAYARRQGRLF